MRLIPGLLVGCLSAAPAGAATVQFAAGDFDTVTPVFSTVTTFDFRFTVTEPLIPGGPIPIHRSARLTTARAERMRLTDRWLMARVPLAVKSMPRAARSPS
ncbi:MAG: hypothetical protein AAFU49_06295 [Pseudomonadota bacterium]